MAEALLLIGLLLTASILKAVEPSAPPKPQTSQAGDEAVLFETPRTDRRYADPLSAEHLTATMQRAARRVFVKLTWRGGD